ncbi:lysozyme inhibitor LprI family protein [Pseudorhodobacter sp.]|uniref:lysozyme inhibitor LprI family protein n=1 Tax=Pseudorhodobacter sp. TaxID=1934400 RepID=UPI00264930FA|nr:lysozyme inhibitor LprI family protein [Pseudorhodobacter sp.]MDN5787984.1 lysozyme inhibitor LprI family protein [Pseudorhodobacter sp.]
MVRTTIATLGLMALTGFGANAQSGNCANAADQATLNLCANQELKTADARLNKTYRALTRKLGPDSLNRLKKGQRAWIAYRDAICAFEAAPSQDGSIYPMVMADCLAAVTASQTALLEDQLNCEEGDMSCVSY